MASTGAAQPVVAAPTGSTSVRLTAAGDHGGTNSRGGRTLNLVATLAPSAHLALGDFSYSELTPESAWCDWVINGDAPAGVTGVGSIPVQLIGGNHEEDSRLDGFIRNFAACLPDRLGSVGDYGAEYYTDIGGLVRVIMIAADVTIDGEHYDYNGGPHRTWLEQAVTGARASGVPWVVVGMHKNCVTVGTKSCEIGESVMDWLLAPGRADLILQGHDHGVQRSHQLSCVDVGTSTPACLADTDGSHEQGAGGVLLVGGTFGQSARTHNADDSEAGYFAAFMPDAASASDEQQGVWQLDFTATSLTGRWVGSTSAYTDRFNIERAVSIEPTPPPPPDGGTAGDESGSLDNVPPRVGLKLRSKNISESGSAVFRVACPAREKSPPCTGTLKLKTHELVIHEPQLAGKSKPRRVNFGRKRFEIGAGQRRGVTVRIPRRNRTLLNAPGGLRVRAVVTAHDAAGNRKRVRKLVTLGLGSN